jgi:hypothetical protein
MNFNIAYDRWLQAYQRNDTYKLDYALLLNKIRLLAGILKTQLTSSDESDLMSGVSPKVFCATLDKSWTYAYDEIVMEWIKGENTRKDYLIQAEKSARNDLFNHIGTLPQETFLDSNLTYFMGIDVTPDNEGYCYGNVLKHRWVNHLNNYGFTTEVRQVSNQNKFIQAIYTNVNDRLKFVMCYPYKEWEHLDIDDTLGELQRSFYEVPNFRDELEYLFKEDYIMGMSPEEIMAEKICIYYNVDLDLVLSMADKFAKVMNTPKLISLGLVGQMLDYGHIESYLNTYRPDSQMIMEYKYRLIQEFNS